MTSLFRSPPRPSINRAGYAESVPLVSPTRGAGSDDDDDGIIEDLETEVNSSKVPLKLRTSFTETLLNFIKVPFESHGHTRTLATLESHGHTRRPTSLETRALTRTRLTNTHLTDTNWGPRPLRIHKYNHACHTRVPSAHSPSPHDASARTRTHAHLKSPKHTTDPPMQFFPSGASPLTDLLLFLFMFNSSPLIFCSLDFAGQSRIWFLVPEQRIWAVGVLHRPHWNPISGHAVAVLHAPAAAVQGANPTVAQQEVRARGGCSCHDGHWSV
jgi:hypothetical protein